MKKENKKGIKIIKITTITLAIVLITMISFFGIYTKNKGIISNKLKNYNYSMALKGNRTIELNVADTASEEALTEENYNKAKDIIGKRLKNLGVQEYNIAVNNQTGTIQAEIPENKNTDTIVGNLTKIGKFEVTDTETGEVLLDNSDIKASSVLYNNASTGTAVYLEIAFNKTGKNKLKEISKTYVKTEETNTTSENETEGSTSEENKEKTITMKIDDEEITSTSFDEVNKTGKIQLTVGGLATDEETLQGYVTQAQNVAVSINDGNLPIEYNMSKNEYILASKSIDNKIAITISIFTVAVVLGIIVLMVKFKTKGILVAISYIGFIALYLLVVRYTNVIISIESILGIITTIVLNYIFIIMLLNKTTEYDVKKATNETYKHFFTRTIPICIMSIAFSFAKWIPISSFGMILFWGLAIIAIYNISITKILLKIGTEEK